MMMAPRLYQVAICFFGSLLLPIGSAGTGHAKPPKQKEAAAAGFSTLSFSYEGRQRSALVYKPQSLEKRAEWPVLFAFHGGEGNGKKFERQTGLSRTADKFGFLLVYPDAGGRQWNDGRLQTNDGVDDIGFVRQLLTEVRKMGPTNAERFYAAGISNGGMLTLRLACETPELFDGFGVLSASFPKDYIDHCKPKAPSSIILIHGSKDPIMPWGGGTIRSGARKGKGGDVIGLPKTLEFWRAHNDCSEKLIVEPLPGKQKADETSAEVSRGSNCKRKFLTYYHLKDGGHTWPGASSSGWLRKRIAGNTSKAIDANEVLAEAFFGRK